MRWRPFIVGMLVGGGLVAFGAVLGVALVAGRSPDGSPAEATPSGVGPFSLLPRGTTTVLTPTPLPTPTPIPLASCTVASGQGNATIVFTAPEPNGMCRAFIQGQTDLP